jgi:hypothetical protein
LCWQHGGSSGQQVQLKPKMVDTSKLTQVLPLC